MIDARPYEDFAALSVFRHLDHRDMAEAVATRGAALPYQALWAEWRAAGAAHFLSMVVHDQSRGGVPFAVLALAHTGQAGVAQAALLARDHRRHARALAVLAGRIRDELPGYAQNVGLRRIEARSWAGHPGAATFLRKCGFTHECDMPGFGGGAETFRQFAWINPTQQET